MFRIITGVAVMAFGLWLIYMYSAGIFATLYGLVITGVGVAILLNKKEDEIEKITKDTHNNQQP
ncbi:MAG: hypothetical protein KC877_03545 [Candidatus Kaiserbacteria bacterium]|nr:hypothetical protein [Candidatus Kaiserbacteria bacterium]MCB9816406.1 hypothetical protein [Candidatus Nomurabacteria bacterium]